MTCLFLAGLTFGQFLAPVPEEEFRKSYWEQKPLVVHRGNRDYYGDLFTLQDFDEAIARAPNYVKLANAATVRNRAYRTESTPGLESVLTDMRDGGTLVLDHLHKHDPKLGLLCRTLGAQLGHRFFTNLYLTPPRGKGFTPHWDNHDVFILQVMGSKHWKIEKERRTFPTPEERMDDEAGRELRGAFNSFTLEQGDLIYIPRGFVHAAECGDESSLHITLGFAAVFLNDLLHAAIKAAARRDPNLRAALAPGFMNGRGKELVHRVMTAFREITDEKFVTAVVDQYRDELVIGFPLDISGQVVDYIQPSPLTVEDVVAARRGVMYRINSSEDSVRVNIGARSVTFPGFFRGALKFALATPQFAIRDIPGELEDEERIAFIERLIQEGLIVREKRLDESLDCKE